MSSTKSQKSKSLHVIGCGQNVNSCLGNSEIINSSYYDISIPKTVKEIKKLITGNTYSAFIDQNGRFFHWGQLTPKMEIIENPTLCMFYVRNNMKVIDAACMNDHAAVITNNNQVYIWGHNYKNYFPNCNKEYVDPSNPLLVEFPVKDAKPISIVCGGYFVMTLFDNGNVYAFGFNQENSLGVEDPDKVISTPTIMELSNIIQISAGWSHGCAVNKNHILYTWGRPSFGRLGHIHGCYISDVDISLTNQSNSNSKDNDEFLVKMACCSHTSTFAVTLHNEVFSCGWNRCGENAVGHRKSTRHMRRVIFNSLNSCSPYQNQSKDGNHHENGIAMISGGAGSFIILDENETAYSSGSNRCNLICLGKECSESVSLSQICSFRHVKCMTTGYLHSLFAVEF